MLKINLNNLYFDGLNLIRNNKVKFIILILFCVLGIGFGISSTMSLVNSTTKIINISNINIVLLINGSKSIFGYFLSRLLALSLLFALIIFCSYKFIFTFISAGGLFCFCFITVRNITLIFAVVKLLFLPVALICIIPCFICYTLVFCLFILYTMEKSREFSYYKSGNYLFCVSCIFKVCHIPAIPLFLICVIEILLSGVLTIGIVI